MATFSYAQAAKGLSSTSTPAHSKAASGSTTPGKDVPAASSVPSFTTAPSWAEDAEAEDARTAKQTSSRDGHSSVAPTPSKQVSRQDPNTISGASSPDLGASSTSTAVKEDDTVSLQNASSDSTTTWEKQSQASTSVERTSEPADKNEKPVEKSKGKKPENAPIKLLQDAPVPVVNPWTRRADERKAQVVPKPGAPKSNATASTAPSPNGVPHGAATAATKNLKSAPNGMEAKEKPPPTENQSKAREEDKTAAPRRDTKPDADAEKAKKAAKGRPVEKDGKSGTIALPLPPDRDQESWPTPETALDEDRKKAHTKGDKPDKERKESVAAPPHGKNEWVKIPYIPTVVFNTPLPNTATSRRGGRGGSRGGAQSGGRNNGSGATSAGSADKDASVPPTVINGESKRGRADASGTRDDSPRDKRTGSIGSPPQAEAGTTTSAVDRSSSATVTPESDISLRKASVVPEQPSATSASNQNHSSSRPYSSNRPSRARRGGMSPSGDRRKDGDSNSPTKEAWGSYDRRTDLPEEGDRRASTFHEFQNGHTKSNDRRQFGSFSGRERGRGGGRGGRGGYQNGHHQFTNGHAPSLQSSSTFPLPRSPTTFHPEQNAFYPAASHGRNGRGPRSQSVTADNVYTRMPGFPGGPQQMPPLNTYMGGMYDMPMMHPLSASPYGSYGFDQPAVFSMVKMQL
jgi:la-related protein 1